LFLPHSQAVLDLYTNVVAGIDGQLLRDGNREAEIIVGTQPASQELAALFTER
jgi:hypothetical protein